MKLTFYITILLAALLAFGCSQGAIMPDGTQPDITSAAFVRSSNEWIWGSYRIVISSDRTQADLLAVRNSSSHLNINKFVEENPCPNCLKIGKPHAAGNGTIKFKVWLQHPFPNNPEFTGFDVRGVLVFKATDYLWTYNYHIDKGVDDYGNCLMYNPKLYYSDPAKGGAGLLNADGYTFYLNPLLVYKKLLEDPLPIFNYSKGRYAYGDSPDCTVNPYILFSDGSPRRMFKVTDFIQREFHVKPPSTPGDFEFGYVVHACWALPTNTPVTDPANDFPVIANCEDPYNVVVEQLQPVTYGIADLPVFKATVKHRKGEWTVGAKILAPGISTNTLVYYPHENFITSGGNIDSVTCIDDETTEVLLDISPTHMEGFGDTLIPGYHLGIFQCLACGMSIDGEGYPSMFFQPLGVWPVMVYVEV